MDNIQCPDCFQTFCSRYNLSRHIRNKHKRNEEHMEKSIIIPPVGSQELPRATTGVPEGPPEGPPQGAPETHMGAPRAHLGAPRAHLGAPRAHVEATEGAQLGVPQGPLGSHEGVSGAPSSELNVLPAYPDDITILVHPFTMMISGPTGINMFNVSNYYLKIRYTY